MQVFDKNLPTPFFKNRGTFLQKRKNALRNARKQQQKSSKFLGTKIFS